MTQIYMDIALVNFRQPQLTVDCLESLEKQMDCPVPFTVWVCENGSADDSASVLKREIAARGWQSWVKLRISEENTGFSGGNNLLVEEVLNLPERYAVAAENHYIFLLNNDTIVRDNGLKYLCDFMAENPQADACASRLEYPDGTAQASAFRFPGLFSEIESAICFGPVSRLFSRYKVAPPQQDKTAPTQWVAGASLLVRRNVLNRVGLLDHGFWTYFEDVDFCKRLAQQNFSLWYVPQARIVHLVGGSSGIDESQAWKKRRAAFWYQARRRYFLKHHGFAKTLLIDACEVALSATGLLIRRLRGLPPHKPKHYLKDFIKHSSWANGPTLPYVEAPK